MNTPLISVHAGIHETIKQSHVAQTHLLWEEGIWPSYFCQWFKTVEISIQYLVGEVATDLHERRGPFNVERLEIDEESQWLSLIAKLLPCSLCAELPQGLYPVPCSSLVPAQPTLDVVGIQGGVDSASLQILMFRSIIFLGTTLQLWQNFLAFLTLN